MADANPRLRVDVGDEGRSAAPEPAAPARPRSDATRDADPSAHAPRRTLVQARVVVGLALIAGAVVWAIARGLRFYGVNPIHLAYDLDQPPWLLVLVSAWLVYRSRRR